LPVDQANFQFELIRRVSSMSATTRGRGLNRPSFDDVPIVTTYGLSEEEWRGMQEKRKAFKHLPFNRNPYTGHDGKLQEQEQACFCAAGFFTWRLGRHEAEVLMVWEDRKGRRLLNFPGGNRNTAEEGPQQVAIRETIEETAFLLSSETISAMASSLPVIWIPKSKYALYVFELPTDCTDGDVDTRFASLQRGEAGGPLALMTKGGVPVWWDWPGCGRQTSSTIAQTIFIPSHGK